MYYDPWIVGKYFPHPIQPIPCPDAPDATSIMLLTMYISTLTFPTTSLPVHPVYSMECIYGPSLCPGSGLRGMFPNATGAFVLGSTPYLPYVF